jgi:hypothetical protein
MTALVDSLTQLAETTTFQYLNLATKAAELEAQAIAFAEVASFLEEECISECASSFDFPDYILPYRTHWRGYGRGYGVYYGGSVNIQHYVEAGL